MKCVFFDKQTSYNFKYYKWLIVNDYLSLASMFNTHTSNNFQNQMYSASQISNTNYDRLRKLNEKLNEFQVILE